MTVAKLKDWLKDEIVRTTDKECDPPVKEGHIDALRSVLAKLNEEASK